jgi:hypothetical protein
MHIHVHENTCHAGKQHILAANRDKDLIYQGFSVLKDSYTDDTYLVDDSTNGAPLLPDQITPVNTPFTNVEIGYLDHSL